MYAKTAIGWLPLELPYRKGFILASKESTVSPHLMSLIGSVALNEVTYNKNNFVIG